MKRIAFLLAILNCTFTLKAQQTAKQTGEVTFVTASNIYMRFPQTNSIEIGDTLYVLDAGKMTPCLRVVQKSSSSCVGESLGGCIPEKGDQVVHLKNKVEQEPTEQKTEETGTGLGGTGLGRRRPAPPRPTNTRHQQIRARIGLASYSRQRLFNPEEADAARHRAMVRFSLDADNIADSPVSFECYGVYRHSMVQGAPLNLDDGLFNVYNLAVSYELEDNLKVLLGRKVNRNVSSIGAIDGLQFEKNFGDFRSGAVVGFRPDFTDFGLNTDLLEYGFYAGHQLQRRDLYVLTTLGALEQRHLGEIDRRYVYFQHSGTFFQKLNLFGSAELDIYDRVNDTVSHTPRLVNLYASARYRFNRKFSISLSYDTRRQIIFYDTYKTEVERLLADDEARQGARASVRLSPVKYLSLGVSYGKRFQSDNQNKSDNLNAYLTYSKLPLVGGRLTLNANLNKTTSLESRILGVRYARSLFNRHLLVNAYYRLADYRYLFQAYGSQKWYAGMNVSYRITRTLRLSVLGEISGDGSASKTLRLNTKITKTWNSK